MWASPSPNNERRVLPRVSLSASRVMVNRSCPARRNTAFLLIWNCEYRSRSSTFVFIPDWRGPSYIFMRPRQRSRTSPYWFTSSTRWNLRNARRKSTSSATAFSALARFRVETCRSVSNFFEVARFVLFGRVGLQFTYARRYIGAKACGARLLRGQVFHVAMAGDKPEDKLAGDVSEFGTEKNIVPDIINAGNQALQRKRWLIAR